MVAYFSVATVLICFLNVYLRYALGVGYVWLQESYIWTHVAVIMFGARHMLCLQRRLRARRPILQPHERTR